MADKVIGILGGMGPEATLDLFGKIIAATPAARDQDHLRVVIDSNPKVPDRTAAILAGGESPVPAMTAGIRALQRGRRGLRGHPVRVGPLVHRRAAGGRPADPVHVRGHRGVHPGAAPRDPHGRPAGDHRHPACRPLRGRAGPGRHPGARARGRRPGADHGGDLRDQGGLPAAGRDCSRRARGGRSASLARGAEGIITGCTELPLVLRPGELALPVFDTLSILARAAVARAGVTPKTTE